MKMKALLLKGWTAWRLIRLVLGLLFTVVGIYRAEYVLSAAGAYLVFMSVFNQGCAGGTCNNNY
jgi:hypothetical protein